MSGQLIAEETNKKSLEKMVQRMGKEAVQWGLVAGVYSGMSYGMQEARGVHDWVSFWTELSCLLSVPSMVSWGNLRYHHDSGHSQLHFLNCAEKRSPRRSIDRSSSVPH